MLLSRLSSSLVDLDHAFCVHICDQGVDGDVYPCLMDKIPGSSVVSMGKTKVLTRRIWDLIVETFGF